jgi:hypothetical protein
MHPRDVRPVPVLIDTTHYLLSLLPSHLSMSVDLYHFLDDRFRAIRSDLILQSEAPMKILQPITRFYLLAQCVLLHESLLISMKTPRHQSLSKERNDVSHPPPCRIIDFDYLSLRKLLEDQLLSALLLVRHSSAEFQRYFLLMHAEANDLSFHLRQMYMERTTKFSYTHAKEDANDEDEDNNDAGIDPDAQWTTTLQRCTPQWTRGLFLHMLYKQDEHTTIFHRAISFGRLPAHYYHMFRVLSKTYTKQDKFQISELMRLLDVPTDGGMEALCRGYQLVIYPSDRETADGAFVRFNEQPLGPACDEKNIFIAEALCAEFQRIDASRKGASFKDLILHGPIA